MHRRALALTGGLGADAAPVLLDDVARDEQAEPETAHGAALDVGRAAKRLPDRLEARRWDADAVVPHRQRHAAVRRTDLDPDLAARVLGRVVEQVQHDLLE